MLIQKIYRKIKYLRREFLLTYYSFYNKVFFLLEGVNVVGNPKLIKGKIYVDNSGYIEIGNSFMGNSGKYSNPIGGDIILRLITSSKNARIIIGKNVGISNSTIYCSELIIIEDNVMIGGSVKIWDTNFHSINYKERIKRLDDENIASKPIIIKKNAFIGSGVIILKGVIIGENSIIAAGSVVTQSIPANEIWGGNPINFIRTLN